jgi:hypothetical protein
MRNLLWLLVLTLAVLACSGPSPEELASLAAKGYYNHLIHGEYEQFLEGKSGADSLPEDYREQLLTSYRQFLAQQESTHHGIREVRISRASADTLEHYTNVFLVLCYGDSVNEEIVVPMVEGVNGWRMK